MGQIARQIATDIVARMQKIFEFENGELTDEGQFAHLDLPAYRRAAEEMHAKGFAFVADIATPPHPILRITRLMRRNMLSADGHVAAAYYQYKPGTYYMNAALLMDLSSCKPLAAVKSVLRCFRPFHCMDLETEFDDGRQLVTTNLGDVFLHAHPTMENKYFPVDTPISTPIAHHDARIAAIVEQGHQPAVLRTADDILQFQMRQLKLRIAHREAVGWITEEELVRSFLGKKRMARAVHREVVAMREKQVREEQGNAPARS